MVGSTAEVVNAVTSKPKSDQSCRIGWSTLGLSLLLLAPGCGQAEPAEGPTKPPLVEAVQARLGELPLEETVHGVVNAENEVSIRPEIEAPVAEVLVRSGEAVKAGQVLVRLRDDELKEQLRRAEADVRTAEANAAESRARTNELEARLRRLEQLAADDLVSPQELESLVLQLEASRASAAAAEARVEQARASADERRSALAKTRVRAPVAGRVGERQVEVGMLVDPGTELFRVGRLERVIVEVTLTEAMLSRVRAGQPVLILPRGSGARPIEARLTRVSPFLAPESFTTVGEIDLDNSDGRLRPGMFVTVQLLFGSSERATLIPTSALWEDPRSGERGVFVVDDAEDLVAPAGSPNGALLENPDAPRSVSFRRVDVLAEGRGRVGVEGVAPGEWVVIAGQHLLRRNMQDDSTGAGGAGESTPARIRPAAWERVAALQSLQREDLLEQFLDKQQRVARALGAAIPEDESVVREILESETGAPGAP
jgi:RND family efflux transporter MFP subunit